MTNPSPILALRILRARLRRTLHDYRAIWRGDQGRLAHLRKCWRTSSLLIVVSEDGDVWELPF